MKKYILLFLLAFQMVFSQEIVIKGKVFNSKEHELRSVDIVLNDTIKNLMDYNHSLFAKYLEWEKKSKFREKEDKPYSDYKKNDELFR